MGSASTIPLTDRDRAKLRRERERLGLSQDALAERVGISRVMVNYIESGAKEPSYQLLGELCEVLGLVLVPPRIFKKRK